MLKFKYKILFTLCLSGVMMGCEGVSSFPGNDEILDEYEGNISTEEGKVPVMIDVGTFTGEIESEDEATRAKTSENFQREKNIYIYSFARNTKGIFDVTSNINKEVCLIDAINNGDRSLAGKKAEVQDNYKRIKWIDSPTKEYYPKNRLPYEFYGYYLDGATLQYNDIQREKERIRINLTFDGSNDFMLARSELNKELLNRYSEAEQEKIKMTYYSGYTTTMNYNPSLEFHHIMTKFSFHIIAMNDEAQNVFFNDVACKMDDKLVLTVVSDDVTELGAKLLNQDAAENTSTEKDKYKIHLREGHEGNYGELRQNHYHGNKNSYTKIGGDLLLPPNDSIYNIRFGMRQQKDGTVHTFNTSMQLTNNGQIFEANKQYSVRIKVYGLQNIVIEVSLEKWENGGENIIDPDPFLKEQEKK